MTEEFPVVKILTPLPMDLAAAIYRAIDQACKSQGYEAFAKEADGLGVIHARLRDRKRT